MKKWDLYVVDFHGDADGEFKKLAALAEQGWELVSVVNLQMCRRAYFKREIPDPSTPLRPGSGQALGASPPTDKQIDQLAKSLDADCQKRETSLNDDDSSHPDDYGGLD